MVKYKPRYDPGMSQKEREAFAEYVIWNNFGKAVLFGLLIMPGIPIAFWLLLLLLKR